MSRLELFSLLVDDYDRAIAFFTEVLGFELSEDSPSLTNDGRAKRWVVVRPPGAATGLLLARADGPAQEAGIGRQFFGRVGLFHRVRDFDLSPHGSRGGQISRRTAPRSVRASRGLSGSVGQQVGFAWRLKGL